MKIMLLFINSFLYYDKPWTDVNFPILAGLFVCKSTFNIEILYEFLNDIIKGKYDKVIKNINEYHLKLGSRITSAKFLPFGMDEYFLNHILRNEFKINKLRILVNIFMDVGKLLKQIHHVDHLFSIKEVNNIYDLERKTWDGDMDSLKIMMRKSDNYINIIAKKGLYQKYKKVIDKYKEFSKLINYKIPGINSYKVYNFS